MRRLPGKSRWLVCGIAALCALVLGLLAVFLTPAKTPAAPSAALLAAANGLDQSVIEARLDPTRAQLTVTQTLTLMNREDHARNTLVLRAWPNAFRSADTSPAAFEDMYYAACYPQGFSAGSLTLEDAQLSRGDRPAAAVQHRYLDEAKTVLSLPTPDWLPGETLTLHMAYTVSVPRMAYRFGVSNDIWALSHCFLLPALYEDGAYRTEPYPPVGDPLPSELMNHTVSLTVPSGYLCAGSGLASAEETAGETTYRFTSLAMRDFALVVSNRFHMAQRKRGDVTLTAYATSAARANALLKNGEKALSFFSDRYGAYPYPSYTLCEIDFPMGGMEAPALSMIAKSQLDMGGDMLESVVAHETAHQWWYAVVGSDPWYQAWQDEALCELSVLEYWERYHGGAAREERERPKLVSLRVTAPRGVTPGAPLDRFTTMAQYSILVYDRGCAMLMALDDLLPDGLTPFLRAYYERYAFRTATRNDFETLLAQVTGEDLAPLTRDYLDTYIQN